MKNLTKIATYGFVLLIISKVLGLSREMLMAYKYGASYINDVYAVVVSVPTVIFSFFASGITNSYGAVYARVDRKDRFFSNITTSLIAFSVFFSLLFLLLSDYVVRIFAPGFTGTAYSLAKGFISIVVWYLPLYTFFAILCAHYQIQEHIIICSFCDYIVVNLVVIASILLSDTTRIYILMVGYIASMIAALIMLYAYGKKHSLINYKPIINLHDKDFILLLTVAIPLGVSSLLGQVNSMVDKMFATTLGEGVTTALGYADRIQSLFLVLTTTTFLNACYPRIINQLSSGNKKEGLRYIQRGYDITFYFCIPFVFLIIDNAQAIISIVFEHGNFVSSASVISAECLKYYAIGILFYSLNLVENRTLSAELKQKLISKNAIISVVINIILDFVFVKEFGYIGLPLATSLAGIVGFVVAAIDLKKCDLLGFDRTMFKEIFKIMVGSVIAYACSWYTGTMMEDYFAAFWVLSVKMAVYGFTYIFVNFLLKVSIQKWMLNHVLQIHKH